MCVNCIRNQVDITEGIQKQVTILWCKMCGRYLQPPKHWLQAEQESKELLTFCIKRIRGMQKVKLVDAGFIWTEPHSMRLKVKLTVQAEVMNGAILQQSFVVEFVVERHMCPACNRQNANPNSWIACVQVGIADLLLLLALVEKPLSTGDCLPTRFSVFFSHSDDDRLEPIRMIGSPARAA